MSHERQQPEQEGCERHAAGERRPAARDHHERERDLGEHRVPIEMEPGLEPKEHRDEHERPHAHEPRDLGRDQHGRGRHRKRRRARHLEAGRRRQQKRHRGAHPAPRVQHQLRMHPRVACYEEVPDLVVEHAGERRGARPEQHRPR